MSATCQARVVDELRAHVADLLKKARHAREIANPLGKSWQRAADAEAAHRDAERELLRLEQQLADASESVQTMVEGEAT